MSTETIIKPRLSDTDFAGDLYRLAMDAKRADQPGWRQMFEAATRLEDHGYKLASIQCLTP